MPSLTIKKFDGTTDIVWSLMQPGGSDSSRPAIFQSTTVGTAQSHRPELRVWVKRTDGVKNVVTLTGHYPVLSTNSTTGVTSVIAKQRLKAVFEFDNTYDQVSVNESTAQFINLMDNPAMVDMIRYQASMLS